MSASAAIHGFGTKLQVSISSSYTDIGEIQNINDVMSRTFSNTTHMESPGMQMEAMPSIIDPGSVTFECNYIPSASGTNPVQFLRASMLGTLTNGTKAAEAFKIVYPDSGSTTDKSFSAHVESVNERIAYDDVMRLTVTLHCVPTRA